MPHQNALRGPWLKPGITERLVELHALTGMATMSMGEMAAKLTFEFDALITRNAVIGRCQRLGLASRPQGQRIIRPPKLRKRSPRKRSRFEEPIAPPEPLPNEIYRPLTIYDLNDGVCKWVLEPVESHPPYTFCGRPALREGCAWCSEHYARTHVVTRERVEWA